MDTSVSRPESCQKTLRTVGFGQLCNNYEFVDAAPHNGVVCVRVIDSGSYTSHPRTLTVQEVLNTGELVPWNGAEKSVDFAARCNKDWEATLVVVAVDTSGSTPQAETKTTRVKLKGTVFVGEPDE